VYFYLKFQSGLAGATAGFSVMNLDTILKDYQLLIYRKRMNKDREAFDQVSDNVTFISKEKFIFDKKKGS
jgi:hypothetical protein